MQFAINVTIDQSVTKLLLYVQLQCKYSKSVILISEEIDFFTCW